MSIPHEGHELLTPYRVNTEAGETGAVYEAQCTCGERFRAASDREVTLKAEAHIGAVGLFGEDPRTVPVGAAVPEPSESEPTPQPRESVPALDEDLTETEAKPVSEEAPRPPPGPFASSPRGARSPRRTRR